MSCDRVQVWVLSILLGLGLPATASGQQQAPAQLGQNADARNEPLLPQKPASRATIEAPKPSPQKAPPRHAFWDRENILLFSGVAVFRGLDYASTRNFQSRGRTEILLPDDVVNNSAGFASLEAAGAATSVGLSYLFHRTGHHKMERWLSLGHIGVTAFGVAWNYSLESKHPR
jgi:hypothetical protein